MEITQEEQVNSAAIAVQCEMNPAGTMMIMISMISMRRTTTIMMKMTVTLTRKIQEEALQEADALQ